MTTTQYPACIRDLYESEIFGEAASLAVLQAADNERDKYHFGTLLQLETETKARLRPFLAKYGLSLCEEMDLGDVPGAVAAYKGGGMQGFAAANAPVVESFLARFKEIEQAGPPEDKEVLQSMIRHEMAILEWMNKEAQGPADGSLNAIIAELQYPLPKP
ncbi:MAG: hypothetical protein GXP04_04645 [Alphaproteobacteria bacterium]|nr:hypothetical protein [Alphaproteobacteria bacterium]